MAVIYLDPKPNFAAALGDGLKQVGTALGNYFEQQKKKQVAQRAAGIQDPEAQTAFIMQSGLSNEDSKDLVSSLTKARMDKLNMALTNQEMVNAKTKGAEDSLELQNLPTKIKLQNQADLADIRLRAAQTTEAGVRAAVGNSEIAKNQAETSHYMAEAAIMQHQANMAAGLSAQVNEWLKNPDSAANDATHPPIAAKPGATPVPVDTAKAITNFALGKTSLADAAASLPNPTGLYQGENRLHMSPLEAAGVQADLAAGKVNEATTKLAAAAKFVTFKDVDMGGGITQKVGYRSDGSTQVVGQPFFKPARLTAQDEQKSDGVLLWDTTVSALKELKDNGKLGDQKQRLMLSMFPGIFDRSDFAGGDASRVFNAVREHARIGAAQMLAGRRTQLDTTKLEETLPKLSDPDDKFDASFKASKNLAFTTAKDILGDFASSGKPLPTELKNYILENKLDEKSDSQLMRETLGIDDLPNVGGGKRGGDGGGKVAENGPGATPGGGQGGRSDAAPADRGGASGGASTGSGTDIKPYVVGGKMFTPEQLEEIAKKHGLSVEQVKEGLANAAGAK